MSRFDRLLAALLVAVPLAAFGAEALYPSIDRAKGDVESAMKEAKKTNKRVIVDFGGNWCTDCRILDINLKKPENAALLAKHYVMVHVNVGDKGISDNFDVAERYGIPLKKGVPALAVLGSDGRVVYAQKNGEFESMRKMDPQSVNDFLTRWSGR
jgi:thiol:disulfide interchange protein